VEVLANQPTTKGPAEWFTGDVWIDGIARSEEPSRVRVSAVRFSPAARTAWHSHALGQTLYVTEGRGLVQSRGCGIVEIRPGDIIYTPADDMGSAWQWSPVPANFCQRGARRSATARIRIWRTGTPSSASPAGAATPRLAHRCTED
jgi:hypothetical protein